MLSFFRKQWFLIGVSGAAFIAYNYPDLARFLRHWDIFSVGIFLSFFATGLGLETQSILRQVRGIRAPAAALFSSLILYPLLAWLTARPLFPDEFIIGICIIGTAPVTVSSGTIMTAIAGGNVPLSLLICILTNFVAFFSIPLMLSLLLNIGGDINLPVLQLLGGLALKVLLPLFLGQLVRPAMKPLVKRYGSYLSVFQSSIIILIIFNAVSSSAAKASELGGSIIGVSLFIICLHFSMLFINYWLARLLFLDRPSLIAFTIHTSQKTLAVSYIVWSAHFAASYPASFIPAIVCQLTQMAAGTFVAEYFKSRSGSPSTKR